MFLAEGIDAVSLDAIATGAGVSRATIYQHFAGKPPLLEALLIEDWERQATLFAQLGADTATPDQAAVQVWLHRVVAGMRRASGSFALHRAALGLNEGLVEAHRAHRQRLAALLRARLGVPDRGSETDRARVESAIIIAAIEYLATAALSEWTAADTETAISLMSAQLFAFSSGPIISR
jgi:AcrR family transcriptional regulator